MSKIILILIITLLVGTTTASSFYFYTKYQSLQKSVENQNVDELTKLVEKVGRHILLPQGEQPTIVTVTDKERVSGQTFFLHAENGFKVLVYEKAKKAFLYDPIGDKIIEVGPVTFNNKAEATSSSSVTITGAVTPITIAVYNGTNTNELLQNYVRTLREQINNINVVDQRDTKHKEFDQTGIVDVRGSGGQVIKELVQTLKIQPISMPVGEATPSADFLIILGTDQL